MGKSTLNGTFFQLQELDSSRDVKLPDRWQVVVEMSAKNMGGSHGFTIHKCGFNMF